MDGLIELIKSYPDQINALVAVCALFVSFLSILLTFYTLRLQRLHNFKSLTPIATITVGDFEDMIEVRLSNTGVGPLIIERLTTTDGKKESDDIISWMPEPPEGIYWSTFTANIDGRCIPPTQGAILIQLNGDPTEKKFEIFRNDVRLALSKLTLTVVYKDIYERTMPVKQRNLKWFARHLPEGASIKAEKGSEVLYPLAPNKGMHRSARREHHMNQEQPRAPGDARR